MNNEERRLNSDKIESILKEYLLSVGAKNRWYEDDEDSDDMEDDLVHSFLSNENLDNLPADRLNLIYQEGGGEGEGEHVEAVFSLDDKFYKATWNYYSHYGFSWECLFFTEVKPVEKTVTVYETI